MSDKDWLPKFKAKQLRLLADAQFPELVVTELRSAGIAIKGIPARKKRGPDETVLQLAQREGRVILTLDGDFWDDRKHPIQSIQRGVIFVDEPPREHDRILRAFGWVYVSFAKSYPLDWWKHMKVRAVLGEFEIKMRTWERKSPKISHQTQARLPRGKGIVKTRRLIALE